jgi:hypothetical protein
VVLLVVLEFARSPPGIKAKLKIFKSNKEKNENCFSNNLNKGNHQMHWLHMGSASKISSPPCRTTEKTKSCSPLAHSIKRVKSSLATRPCTSPYTQELGLAWGLGLGGPADADPWLWMQ